jgi:hypothetical protein
MNKLIVISFFLMKYFFLTVTLFSYGIFLNELPPHFVDRAYFFGLREIFLFTIFIIIPVCVFYLFHKFYNKYKNFL